MPWLTSWKTNLINQLIEQKLYGLASLVAWCCLWPSWKMKTATNGCHMFLEVVLIKDTLWNLLIHPSLIFWSLITPKHFQQWCAPGTWSSNSSFLLEDTNFVTPAPAGPFILLSQLLPRQLLAGLTIGKQFCPDLRCISDNNECGACTCMVHIAFTRGWSARSDVLRQDFAVSVVVWIFASVPRQNTRPLRP